MRQRLPQSQIWGTTVIVWPPLPDIVRFMPRPPDLEALARRYVELWQDQIAATAVDPELTDGLARMMHLVGGGLAAQAGFLESLWPDLVARAAAPSRPAPPTTPPEGPRHEGAAQPEAEPRGRAAPEASPP